MELTATEAEELAREVDSLATATEKLKSLDRSRADRRLIRLARALPRHQLFEHARRDLGHKRKLRRMGAYKALREVGVTKELAPKLVSLYETTHDQEPLELLARSPDAVQAVDVSWLISHIDEQYWRMRVIEALMLKEDERAMQFRTSHPHEFVHAAGRAGGKGFAPLLRELAHSHQSDWELLGLITWAFGAFGDRGGVAEMRRFFERELAANPPKLSLR